MTEIENTKAARKAARDIKAYFFLQKLFGMGMALDVASSDFRFRFELSDLFLKIDEKLVKIFLENS